MTLDAMLRSLVVNLGQLRLVGALRQDLSQEDQDRLREAQRLVSQVRRGTSSLAIGHLDG